MPRSIKKSIAIPQPVRDALMSQIQDEVLDYPSENAAWIGMARYQLLIGKPHPVTTAIARMHPNDQDVIDDFLLEISRLGLSLKGQFLSRLVHEVVASCADPTEQEVVQLVPAELLRLAKEWKRKPDEVIERLRKARGKS